MTVLPDLLLLIALSVNDDREDHDLAIRIRRGDRDAFKFFFEKYETGLLSFLISKGMDKQRAEDLLQQAFMIIWEKRSDIKPNRSLRTFLFTLSYNRILNYFRNTRKTEPDLVYKWTDEGPNPEYQPETTEVIKAIQRELEQMPERRRKVFEFCYLQQFTYHETAGAMGISIKTVEKHMTLALRDLRKALKSFL